MIRLVLAVWISGTVLPSALSMLFTFGCCVLPFHELIHRYIPACHITRILLAPSKDADLKQVTAPSSIGQAAGTLASLFPIATFREKLRGAPQPQRRARDLVSLGAVRCDRDIGQQKLLSIWLI